MFTNCVSRDYFFVGTGVETDLKAGRKEAKGEEEGCVSFPLVLAQLFALLNDSRFWIKACAWLNTFLVVETLPRFPPETLCIIMIYININEPTPREMKSVCTVWGEGALVCTAQRTALNYCASSAECTG